MNRVVLIGRLTKDPDLKFTPGTGTAVTTFTLAVDRRFSKDSQREADFIPVVVWGKQAEATANYMGKGKLIGISGRIQTRSYDAKDGSKRYVTEVIADEVQFLEWGNGEAKTTPNTDSFKQRNDEPDFGEEKITPIEDGDIPF